MTNKLTHHPLTAELVNDDHGQAILLAQQNESNGPQSILVHPWQLRAACEQFGIVASDTKAAKTIATLQRRMLGLRERIDKLDYWLTHCSDHRNADLSHELESIGALSDLAREWCADFDSEPAAHAVETDSVAAQRTCAAPTPAAQAALL